LNFITVSGKIIDPEVCTYLLLKLDKVKIMENPPAVELIIRASFKFKNHQNSQLGAGLPDGLFSNQKSKFG
jgi:hypothetical protein